MKAYKDPILNHEVRRVVREYREYREEHLSCSAKYLTNDEFAIDVMSICRTSKPFAVKATWIIRADGDRDKKAMEIFGFNYHTA